MNYAIGVDLGGTNMRAGIVDAKGKVLKSVQQPTYADEGPDAVITRMGDMIKSLILNAGKRCIYTVGVGTPGLVDPVQGVSLVASNLKWYDIPLAERLSSTLNRPVFIDNDVRMYILGEVLAGSAHGAEHVLGVTLGTGLAAAVVTHGELYYGGGYMAGELGHISFDEIPFSCSCGLSGCLETIASATGIVRQAKHRIAQGETGLLSELLRKKPDFTAKHVADAYDQGDSAAKDIFRYTGTMLAKGLAIAITLFSPDMLVIGGGAAASGHRLMAPLLEQLKLSLHPLTWKRLTVTSASLAGHAGIIGSALRALYKFESINC